MTDRRDQPAEPEIRIKGKQPPPPPPAKDQTPLQPGSQPRYPVQGGYQQAGYPQVYSPVVQPPKSGKATAAMVLGICALASITLACCFSLLLTITFVLGILAIIFGILAKNEIRDTPGLAGYGQAQAGLIMGIVGLALSVVIFVVAFFFLGVALMAGA